MKYLDYSILDPSLKPWAWMINKLLTLTIWLAEQSGLFLSISTRDYQNLPLTIRGDSEPTKLSVIQYK